MTELDPETQAHITKLEKVADLLRNGKTIPAIATELFLTINEIQEVVVRLRTLGIWIPKLQKMTKFSRIKDYLFNKRPDLQNEPKL